MLNALTRFLARTVAALRFRSLDRDFEQELTSHAGLLEDEYRRRGMSDTEARREARLTLGGLGQLRDAHRDERGLPLLEAFAADVRYAIRGLRRSPGFTAVAVLVLAIGIGANTAMFSVVHGVLLQPLDYPEAGRLVSVVRGSLDGSEPRWISLRQLEFLRASAQSFTGLAAHLRNPDQVTLSGEEGPEVLRAARVSANFLEVVGVRPILGRSFLAAEDAPGAPAVAMISAELWNRRFAAAPSVAGRTVTIDATSYTIVGVLPAGFRFPFSGVDVWRPQPSLISTVPPQYHACCTPLLAFGRLKDDVTFDQARAELALLSTSYLAANPVARNLEAGALRVVAWKDELTAGVGRMLWMLGAAVAFVLLIACVNIVTLVIARARSRSGEFAVRTAIGAGRGRLVRQLVTEGLVLASTGGLLGLIVAFAALDAIKTMTLVDLPRAEDIGPSGLVLGLTAALSIGAGIVFGVLPAFRTVSDDVAERLRHGTGVTASSGRSHHRGITARGALVIVQVALSMVLLVGAALMLQTLVRLARVDLGFQPEGLLTMRLALAEARYDTGDTRAAMFDEVLRRLESIPGVTGVALVRALPRTGGGGVLATNIQVEGAEIPDPGHVGIVLQTIAPGSFQVLGVPLVRGRGLTSRDNTRGAPPVALVNEAFARRVWPGYPDGQDPIGRQLKVPLLDNLTLEIVGVVADIRQDGPAGNAPPQFYMPTVLNPPPAASLAVRGGGDPASLARAIRTAVLDIDPDQAIGDIRVMTDRLEASVGQQHVVARLMSLFAGTALLLVLVGIYGLLACTIVQRTQEIGIRRAFGAQRSDILAVVLKQAFVLTAIGMICGLAGALAFTRLMEGLLFGISPTDPATFAVAAALFAVVSAAATLIPARRALRIDPTTALKG